MGIKEHGLAIATALADLESEYDIPNDNAVHKALRRALYLEGANVGLSGDDIAEIDNAGAAQRGGEPKEAFDQGD